MVKNGSGSDVIVRTPEETLNGIKGQFESAVKRLTPANGDSTSGITPLISYPVAKLTYLECIEEFDDLLKVCELEIATFVLK